MKPIDNLLNKNVPVLERDFDIRPFNDAYEELTDVLRSVFLRRMDRVGRDGE